ncbi:M23 family metallopeptidase [Myceligenerans sp. I2]|uniref:M23 family metallopeptidase n=2 Tax=Myceligenerans indicum TaxID=2593663 RepID=A0ABS1LK21_9MICO|nr:M23 family metallopeptidase [Myceligenerans indicum]
MLVVLSANPSGGVADAAVGPARGDGRAAWTVRGGTPLPGRPVSRVSGTDGSASRAAGTGRSVYVPPLDGSRPPVAVERGFDPPGSPWGAGHRGVDLATTTGAEVRAPAAGTVVFAGRVAGRGVVVVAHADGLRSSLEPVAAAVPAGTPVVAGERVGTVARSPSGHCGSSPCVHWGIRRDGRYLDPLALLRQDRPVIVLLPGD